jgi:hypothetical protein
MDKPNESTLLEELRNTGKCSLSQLDIDWDKTREYAHHLAQKLGVKVTSSGSWNKTLGHHLVVRIKKPRVAGVRPSYGPERIG